MADEKQGVAFHMGLDQAIFVATMYKKGFNAMHNGNLYEAYLSFFVIHDILSTEISEEELEKLDTLEKNILRARADTIKANKANYITLKNNYYLAVRAYIRTVLRHMKQAGFLPSKRDRTKLNF